jgi:hypothetical protein
MPSGQSFADGACKNTKLYIIQYKKMFSLCSSVKAEHLMTKESNDEISSKQEREYSLIAVFSVPFLVPHDS